MQTVQSIKIPWWIVICYTLALAAGTIVLYWPITHDDFINFDDNAYVTDNPHVKAGLTWAGVKWALTSGYAANWHPLTWISHMIDCQLFGVNAADHHMMNIFFHAANTVLLFILLTYMTTAPGRSAFVAALFAWHPLHVESVAWASERKDVLSAFFWMLTLLCYARYAIHGRDIALRCPRPYSGRNDSEKSTVARNPSEGIAPLDAARTAVAAPLAKSAVPATFYCLALFFFACGLMSKPMVVTLPFVLLLLDFWPLQRLTNGTYRTNWMDGALRRLSLEKMPFFALSFAACAITYIVQKHGGAVVVNDPMSIRASNAFWAYERYIAKTFWPTDLSIVYPYVRRGLVLLGIGSALLLVVCSIAFIALARRWPYLFTGWFWFLGTLVPVIGFVEIGPASMADRYTYIPDIGLFILVTWALANFIQRKALQLSIKYGYPGRDRWIISRSQPFVSTFVACALLAACFWLTHIQISYWRNSVTLFTHAIQVTTNNAVANACVGQALDVDGRDPEALKFCQEAVRIDPQYPAGQFFLGQVLWKLGHPDEAFNHLNLAAKSAPENSGFQYNLGKFLFEHGKTDEAIARFRAALKDDPDFAEAHNALGKAFLQQGDSESAYDELFHAVALDPDNAQFHYDLGTVLLNGSQPEQAVAQFSEALRLKPDFVLAHENLAVALASQGNMADAIAEFDKAVQLQPNDPEAHSNLGLAYLNNHQPALAAEQFSEELRLAPNEPKGHYRLAQALRDQNELAKAVQEYRETLKLSPGFADAKKELDEILAANPKLR